MILICVFLHFHSFRCRRLTTLPMQTLVLCFCIALKDPNFVTSQYYFQKVAILQLSCWKMWEEFSSPNYCRTKKTTAPTKHLFHRNKKLNHNDSHRTAELWSHVTESAQSHQCCQLLHKNSSPVIYWSDLVINELKLMALPVLNYFLRLSTLTRIRVSTGQNWQRWAMRMEGQSKAIQHAPTCNFQNTTRFVFGTFWSRTSSRTTTILIQIIFGAFSPSRKTLGY